MAINDFSFKLWHEKKDDLLFLLMNKMNLLSVTLIKTLTSCLEN